MATPAPTDSQGGLFRFRLFGVPIRLHFTFVLLLVFLIFVGLGPRQSNAGSVLYLLALFASVLLHELGHVLLARRYGIRTSEIVMFPIGGVAKLERQPKPAEELWIALAGPFVNLLIAAALLGFLQFNGRIIPWDKIATPTDDNLLQRLAAGNLVLAAFNMLPAFPMDGGRVLRAILARWRPENEATQIAASAGQMLAIAMGLYGLLNQNFFLVFVAFFVYLGAAQESAAAVGKALIEGVRVRAAMITDFRTLQHANTVREAADTLLATSQQDFPVMLGGQVLGLLTRNALLKALAVEGPDAYVASAMEREFVRLAPDMDLIEALPLLGESGSCALVMDEDQLVGLLTRENLTELLMLRRFGLDAPRPAASSSAP